MSNSLSYLPALYAASFGAGSSILNTMYGGGTSVSGGTVDPVQALRTAQQSETQQVKVTAADPMVKSAIGAFTTAVRSATSIKQLLSNPNVMNVLLTANGMKDQIGYTALATQVLMSNLSDPKSLANTLTDTRWKTLAQTYNFNTKGLAAIQNPTVIASVTNTYAQSEWQSNQDTVTPGLSNALYFLSHASSATSVYQILGDPTLRTVVTTALGVPQQIAFQDLGAQAQAITSRLNISQFQTPSFVQSFAQRYLIQNSANSTNVSTGAPTDLTTLAIQAQGVVA
ncbi:MAG: hypothetical protein B7Z80_00120 [Rhodospirillales bacterium 20-64-7]|nr:MAG: hypothetical protein B7Z80_00120 [Rhodospirillales bacterium 20-64-7]HQT75426.1 DUF1217 domain-containing protein [Rhodopila sp.]